MIRQLMKRDPAWLSVPVLTAMSGAFCVLWHFLPASANRSSSLIFIAVFAALPFTAGYAAATQQGDTRFQAALPVTVRQVYLARVLSMIGLLWLPAAVSAAVAFAIPNPAVPIAALLEFTSLLTLIVVGMQSAGIKGLTIPRWLMNESGFLLDVSACAGAVPISGFWLSGEKQDRVRFGDACFAASRPLRFSPANSGTHFPSRFKPPLWKASPVAVSGVDTVPQRAGYAAIPWIPVMRAPSFVGTALNFSSCLP